VAFVGLNEKAGAAFVVRAMTSKNILTPLFIACDLREN